MSNTPPHHLGTATTTIPPEKPRLTEEEKRHNHIASEQKRRQAIRHAFDRLASIVPGMEGQGRSEAIVLDATVRYIREQYANQQALMAKLEEAGIDPSSLPGLPDAYKQSMGTDMARAAAAKAESTAAPAKPKPKRKHDDDDELV